ncbi:Pseudouridine kinase, partial [Dysosmobacter welbionis]
PPELCRGTRLLPLHHRHQRLRKEHHLPHDQRTAKAQGGDHSGGGEVHCGTQALLRLYAPEGPAVPLANRGRKCGAALGDPGGADPCGAPGPGGGGAGRRGTCRLRQQDARRALWRDAAAGGLCPHHADGLRPAAAGRALLRPGLPHPDLHAGVAAGPVAAAQEDHPLHHPRRGGGAVPLLQRAGGGAHPHPGAGGDSGPRVLPAGPLLPQTAGDGGAEGASHRPSAKAGDPMKKTCKANLPAMIFLFALLILWQAGAMGLDAAYILPSPTQILAKLWELRDVLFTVHLPATMLVTAIGLGISLVLGLALAVVMDESDLVRKMIYPIVVVSQTIPTTAIAPLFVLWFGYGIWSKVLVTVLIT